jgi:hypothetical protein
MTRDDTNLRRIFDEPLALALSHTPPAPEPGRAQSQFAARAELESIGKGAAHRLHEFGFKCRWRPTFVRSKGRKFIAYVTALPGNLMTTTPSRP